jgi:hypothetical protein
VVVVEQAVVHCHSRSSYRAFNFRATGGALCKNSSQPTKVLFTARVLNVEDAMAGSFGLGETSGAPIYGQDKRYMY